MQNPLTSRSIISDKIYKKFSQTAYQIHKQKLKSIYAKDSIKKDIQYEKQSKTNRLRIINNRKAYESCHQKINPIVKLENKALFKNIQNIMKRKSNSQYNLQSFKNHYIENKKKQIKKENSILLQKLVLGKIDIVDTKKNLLKQFQQYESKKNMLRKLKQTPQKYNSSNKRKTLSHKKLFHTQDKIRILQVKKNIKQQLYLTKQTP